MTEADKSSASATNTSALSAAVPSSEKHWKVGDRVGGAWHGGHDAICKSCKRGQFQMCENKVVNGVTREGGYGEYATLRTEAAVSIPKDADPAQVAPLLCAGEHANLDLEM